ncbi:response regulator [Desulforhabdus amnigena]|jgi:DNA-binding NarL/FixJ family response regulator|uniref:Response regulatory domain-containing protein n=1 Tax=Desulforhabdus amnigena TaxID=40218 RepID=A0A9W6D2X3_9BACT|nr:response regulator transcription factor [Desulforhabdus amnigena]NLJ29774.1 response regulator [Deltaproteobacteria bacterium]GLI33237.1 hypothetical protein DAMNIGENAA_06700 [Desulforhabdus amnigena]
MTESNIGTERTDILAPRILIAEDNEILRKSLLDWINVSFPCCDVLEARDGEEAVLVALGKLPDVVVMDIALPKMNGIEATRKIKKETPDIRVVVLTIHEASQYRTDAVTAGADAYILKRKMHSQLIPVLAVLLDSARAKTS